MQAMDSPSRPLESHSKARCCSGTCRTQPGADGFAVGSPPFRSVPARQSDCVDRVDRRALCSDHPSGVMTPTPAGQRLQCMATPPPQEAPGAQRRSRRNLGWLVVLLVGAVVWIVGAAVTAATNDEILVPTLILVGSFLMPLCMVMFALTREGEEQLPHDKILLAFLLGGAVAVVVSAYLEVRLLPSTTGTFLVVGLIEELTKGLVLVVVAWSMTTRRPRDGMVLGATVGAGFAAFESAGYAFAAVIQHQDDHPVLQILQTEISRALWAPFMHITWTALFGGALFAAARADGRFPVTWPLAGTTLGVILMHGVWDQSYGWAILLTKGLRGEGWTLEWPNTEAWVGAPTEGELVTFNVVYDALLLVNAVIGVAWIIHNWRKYGAAASAAEREARCRPVDPTRSHLKPARDRATIEGSATTSNAWRAEGRANVEAIEPEGGSHLGTPDGGDALRATRLTREPTTRASMTAALASRRWTRQHGGSVPRCWEVGRGHRDRPAGAPGRVRRLGSRTVRLRAPCPLSGPPGRGADRGRRSDRPRGRGVGGA